MTGAMTTHGKAVIALVRSAWYYGEEREVFTVHITCRACSDGARRYYYRYYIRLLQFTRGVRWDDDVDALRYEVFDTAPL